MSVVNTITFSTQRRDQLVVSRNNFTFFANIFVLLTALTLFSTITNQVDQFRVLASIIVVLGTVTTLYYIIVIREPTLVKEAKRLQKEFKLNQKQLY
jgi:Na+/melibiose symporter-like transporter